MHVHLCITFVSVLMAIENWGTVWSAFSACSMEYVWILDPFSVLTFHLFPLTGDEVSSGLSDHSSDGLQPPPPPSKTHAPSTSQPSSIQEREERASGGDEEDDSDFLTPTSSETKMSSNGGKPITSQDATLVASTSADAKKQVCGLCIVECALEKCIVCLEAYH